MTLNKLRLNANEKGFTLIELMIVIAIIGILAAIAIPNYISYRDKAYCSGAESDANSILSTISDYYAIPAHTGALTTDTLGPTAETNQGMAFKALTNGNTATISQNASIIRVAVTDVSARCPSGYRSSQSNAGWEIGAATAAAPRSFHKDM